MSPRLLAEALHERWLQGRDALDREASEKLDSLADYLASMEEAQTAAEDTEAPDEVTLAMLRTAEHRLLEILATECLT